VLFTAFAALLAHGLDQQFDKSQRKSLVFVRHGIYGSTSRLQQQKLRMENHMIIFRKEKSHAGKSATNNNQRLIDQVAATTKK
jgi:hypothetical protein